jgi:Holliday junction resolvase
MMRTPEKKVKDKVTALLRSLGVYYFFPVTGGFGRSGVPDIICCMRGRFLGIECKAGGNKATPLQLKNIEAIQAAGGYAFIVNEDNVDALERVLRTLVND